LSVVDEPGGDRVMIGGRYLGSKAQAQETMNRPLASQPAPRTADYEVSPLQDPTITADIEQSELALLAQVDGERVQPRERSSHRHASMFSIGLGRHAVSEISPAVASSECLTTF
jgi:hypothetical protein